MATDIQPRLPGLIAYFRDSDEGGSAQTGKIITETLGLRWHCVSNGLSSLSIEHLGKVLLENPSLLVFHIDFIQKQNSTVQEFVNMVRTLIKYIPQSTNNVLIAVAVNKLTSFEQIKALKDADIDGIIPMSGDFGLNDCLKSYKILFEDRSYWPRHIIDQLTRVKRIKRTARSGIRLTHRQGQVLELVCSRGLSNKKIAQALKISESTVKIHMSAILKQYAVRNRTQLALAARDQIKK